MKEGKSLKQAQAIALTTAKKRKRKKYSYSYFYRHAFTLRINETKGKKEKGKEGRQKVMGYVFKVQGADDSKPKAENCEVKPKAKKKTKK